jgi:tetratricopeptide (TPR) repeat protein
MKKWLLLLLALIMVGCAGEPRRLPDFDALWDYGDPEGTEAAFRDLITAARESGDVSYYAELLTQVARTQGLQRKFERAHSTLDSVEALLRNDMIVPRVRCLLERGRVHNSSKHPEKAGPLFLEAWEIASANHQDFYAIDAAHMLGIVEPAEKQIEWNGKAIQIAETSEDERARRWLGSLYNNTGWTYHEMGQYERALSMFGKGLQWQEQVGNEEGARIARWTIARTHRSLGRVDRALEIQRDLEREIQEKGLQTDGYVYEEIAECLLLGGDDEGARKYFKLAHDLLSQNEWLEANEPERLARLKELGGDL